MQTARQRTDMDESVFTIRFPRRATAYKRADLLFHDIDKLIDISSRTGPLQVIYAGKAHPQDGDGKELIKRVIEAGKQLKGKIKKVYLENYDMRLGMLITSGVDLWLNTPEPPMEASGTSGMKAALNGVPSLATRWMADLGVPGRHNRMVHRRRLEKVWRKT